MSFYKARTAEALGHTYCLLQIYCGAFEKDSGTLTMAKLVEFQRHGMPIVFVNLKVFYPVWMMGEKKI